MDVSGIKDADVENKTTPGSSDTKTAERENNMTENNTNSTDRMTKGDSNQVIGSMEEENEANVNNMGESANTQKEQSFDDINAIAASDDPHKANPPVPANSEYQTSLASIHLPAVATAKTTGRLRYDMIYTLVLYTKTFSNNLLSKVFLLLIITSKALTVFVQVLHIPVRIAIFSCYVTLILTVSVFPLSLIDMECLFDFWVCSYVTITAYFSILRSFINFFSNRQNGI